MQLTSLGILPGFARWSPDGSLIAFHGNPHGRPDVLVVAAQGGDPRVITKGGPPGAYPSFSRDGRWLYFSAGLEHGGSRIWKMPVAGGPATQVTSNNGSIAIESSDGDLYYVDAVDRPGTLWRLARAGGTAVKVLEGIASGNFDVVDHGIYYIERVARDAAVFLTDRPGGDTQLRFFDFTTRRTITVARDLGTIGLGLTASRDGRIILYSQIESSIDELMLVENFR
jgi:dipeptidyl aminopeptidase/acylaminoacyl peptidase